MAGRDNSFAQDKNFAKTILSKTNNFLRHKIRKQKFCLRQKQSRPGADLSLDHTGDRGRRINQNDNYWKFKSYKVIVYWIVMKNKSSELTRLDWVGIRLNQFGMFEERFKLLSR